MRLTLLDGFRGFFLLFMTIAHVNGSFHAVLGAYNHHMLGWVEDAQGFVFISGFVVGLVYTKILDRSGSAGMGRAVLRRIRTIFTYQAVLILAFCAAALGLAAYGFEVGILRQYVEYPVAFTLASLLLVTGSLHMGILALYIWLMLLTPLVLLAFHRNRALWVALISVAAWLLAQSGLPDAAQIPVERALSSAGYGINIGIYFNVFGWQTLYFLGLFLGFLFARERLDTSRMRDPRLRPVFWLAVAGVIGFAIFDRAMSLGWIEPDLRRVLWREIDRGNMHSVYLANFLLDLFVISWLLVAGPDSGNRVLAALGRGLGWLFTRSALVYLGQHSLQVFTAHVVLTYVIMWAMAGRDLPALWDNVFLLLTIAALYLVAWGHDRLTRRATSKPVSPRSRTPRRPTPA
ncbi:OpgC domain-containing protein [Puniceibacterium confluentis]|uniref:OpgC domain-containing protein n=1 Tax=Puniceibacterium confluentis TaxID=1958944 RepID=UPI0016472F73|nr:OpgC domain-containing protein [Puniceibacterium confluentis]